MAIAEITDESGYIKAIEQKVAANAVREAKEAAARAERRAQLEVDFGGSVQRLVADLLEQGNLSAEDRQEIRHLLDASNEGEKRPE
ncbi:MAG: hypothetical protein ACYSWU_20915 [Planctomycetota bacterium]